MTLDAKRRGIRWAGVACAVAAGCAGYALQATSITSTSASLGAKASCSGDTTNQCTQWFQYWQEGSSSVVQTAHTTTNVNSNGYFPINTTVSGLSPSTLYHYQFCGYGDSNINPPGLCTGPLSAGGFEGVNNPGSMPADPGDFSATSNFRTAGPSTKGTADLGRVLTSADTNGTPITRDSGFSVQFSTSPPKVLWVFDDTQQSGAFLSSFGSAAAGPVTPGAAPMSLTELPTPPTSPPSSPPSAPSRFYPPPASPMYQSNGSPCVKTADWGMGAVKEPGGSTVLLGYSELCVDGLPIAERVALAEYDPIANKFLRVDHPFVSSTRGSAVPGTKQISSAVFPGDGYVYFFIGYCEGLFCANGAAVYVARVADRAHPQDTPRWANGSNFRWWWGGDPANSANWHSTPSGAQTIIAGAMPLGGSVHVADYSAANSSKKYVLFEQVGIGVTTFNVYYATVPTGPWTLGSTVQVPEAACTGGPLPGCYAIKGHPELSTSTQLVYSWYSPDDRDGYGHIRLGVIDW